jgi:hypothetical protein
MLSVVNYAPCAECHYTECRGALPWPALPDATQNKTPLSLTSPKVAKAS